MRRVVALLVVLVVPAIWSNADEAAGYWTPAPSIVQAGTLNAVAFGGGRWVAVGRGGAVVAKADGGAWEAVYPGIDDDLNDIVWSGDSFVAVGDGGVILHSHDGTSWSVQRLDLPPLTPADPRSDPEPITLERVIATSDGLVAVGQFRGVVTSDNGQTWTVHPSQAHGTTLAWSGTTYVLAGGEVDFEPSPLYESTDLDTWIEHDDAVTREIREIAWGGTQFLADGTAGGSCAVWSGMDASSWQAVSSQCVTGLTWTGSKFIGVDEGAVLSSPDGESWTSEDTGLLRPSTTVGLGAYFRLRAVAANQGIRIAVGPAGVVTTSLRELPWQQEAGLHWGALNAVVWTGERFAAVGMEGGVGGVVDFLPHIATSEDGLHWTGREVEDPLGIRDDVELPPQPGGVVVIPGANLDDLAACGSRLVATEFEGANTIVASDDGGLRWHIERLLEGLELTRIEGVAGRCVAIGTLQGAVVIARSDDGIAWSSELRIPGVSLNDVAWTAGRWLVAGSPGGHTGPFVATSTDGEHWSLSAVNLTAPLIRLAAANGVFTARDAGGRLERSTDGIAWELAALPPPGRWALPFAVGDALYAATGSFGLYRSSDGSTWSSEGQAPATGDLRAGAASDDREVAVGAGTILVRNPEPHREVSFVPGIAHLPGIGSLWRSDLAITNTADDPATVELLADHRGDPSLQLPVLPLTVPPHRTVRFHDTLWALHGVEGTATLHLDARGGALTSWARTFNQTPDGAYGQLIPAVASAGAIGFGAEARLLQLSESADPTTGFRTNIGVVNLVDEAIEVELTLLAADGAILDQPRLTLGPRDSVQLNRPLAELRGHDVIGAVAVVRTSSPDGRFTAYASVIDNRTGDPTFVRVSQAAGVGQTLWLPGAAHGVGRNGSVWQTDLELHNPGAETATCTLELMPWGSPPGGPWQVGFDVKAGATRRLEDVVATVFGWTSGGATLRVTPTAGTVMAGGRTFTRTSSGSYGQYLPALAESAAAGPSEWLWLTGLEESDTFRSNLGVVNATSIPTEVRISVVVDDGTTLGERELFLAALESLQVDRILADFGGTRATVIVQPLTLDSGVLAYASMIDNRTNDPVLVPAVLRPAPEDPLP